MELKDFPQYWPDVQDQPASCYITNMRLSSTGKYLATIMVFLSLK